MKKILVVVDMQNDFIDGALGTPEARGIVPNVCRKIREGEWVSIFTTHDTHLADYLNTQEGRKLPIEHCMVGTKGYSYNEEVSKALGEFRGYRLDFAKSTFGSKELHKFIHDSFDDAESDLEITLVGVCTDICVISNALLLKTYLPEARIVVDASCCAGSTPLKHDEALDVMRSCQIDIVGDW